MYTLVFCFIVIYLLITYLTYKNFVIKWNQPKWEKMMLSLGWICILPLYGIRKIQEMTW